MDPAGAVHPAPRQIRTGLRQAGAPGNLHLNVGITVPRSMAVALRGKIGVEAGETVRLEASAELEVSPRHSLLKIVSVLRTASVLRTDFAPPRHFPPPRPRPAYPSSRSSRAGTTRRGAIRRSAISRQSTTKGKPRTECRSLVRKSPPKQGKPNSNGPHCRRGEVRGKGGRGRGPAASPTLGCTEPTDL